MNSYLLTQTVYDRLSQRPRLMNQVSRLPQYLIHQLDLLTHTGREQTIVHVRGSPCNYVYWYPLVLVVQHIDDQCNYLVNLTVGLTVDDISYTASFPITDSVYKQPVFRKELVPIYSTIPCFKYSMQIGADRYQTTQLIVHSCVVRVPCRDLQSITTGIFFGIESCIKYTDYISANIHPY